ncbi:MAG: DUF1570 domain-containing protein [Planctomycetaceae bacterium]|nr:DUF1570 domain-containing protein [Planctomycetaceae bacterium]
MRVNLIKKGLIVSFACVMILFVAEAGNGQSKQPPVTIEVPYKQKSYLGRPLAWDGREMMLLRRDGKVSILPVKTDRDYSTVSADFKPYSASEMRRRLQSEFGNKYDVSLTHDFVVVHPPGSPQVWATPFQQLYARFQAYFSTRGFRLQNPEFPMVAIVLRTRGEFDRMLKAFHNYDPSILGYYSPKSNRIITYDQTEGRSKDKSWLFNAGTILHEATHQTAFNTGLHSRFAPVVRWESEGLAMLFEARGVNNSQNFPRQEDRIHASRLSQLKQLYREGKVQGKMAELVVSDDLFRANAQAAYAISWGMTFYFSEAMPSKYKQFLKNDAARTDFASYSKKQRSADFAKAFGGDFKELEARMKRFYQELKQPDR